MTSDSQLEDCSRVVDLLADYLEGRLPSRTHRDLDEHLNACTHCHTQLRTYRTTVSLLRGLHDSDLPAELRTTAEAFLEGQISH